MTLAEPLRFRATLLVKYHTLTALAGHIKHDICGFPAGSLADEVAAAPKENLARPSAKEVASLLAAEIGN